MIVGNRQTHNFNSLLLLLFGLSLIVWNVFYTHNCISQHLDMHTQYTLSTTTKSKSENAANEKATP